LVTPEDADHAVQLSPSGKYALDSYSTPTTAPVTRVAAAAGTPSRRSRRRVTCSTSCRWRAELTEESPTGISGTFWARKSPS